MNTKLFGLVAVCGMFAVACGDSGTSSSGSGGDTGTGGSTSSTLDTVGSTGGSTSNVGPSTSSTGGGAPLGMCDDAGVCGGDGMTAGCLDCAVVGDSTVAQDGGACFDSFAACYGPMLDFDTCAGGNADCCALDACFAGCDMNMNGNIEPGAELDCLCTNDGMQCTALDGAGTCTGDHQAGLMLQFDIIDCQNAVCPNSCG